MLGAGSVAENCGLSALFSSRGGLLPLLEPGVRVFHLYSSKIPYGNLTCSPATILAILPPVPVITANNGDGGQGAVPVMLGGVSGAGGRLGVHLQGAGGGHRV